MLPGHGAQGHPPAEKELAKLENERSRLDPEEYKQRFAGLLDAKSLAALRQRLATQLRTRLDHGHTGEQRPMPTTEEAQRKFFPQSYSQEG